ncbi:hypothetical protein [Streptomyces qinzhouensis]|uniref:Secreted protein n=1 Tax=Streptomyces qinzhouensis TaxID=2599401 RepID=A0A5B8JD45_9ACTN|nr:hypothetical protein [Streptomyces qinzhouensis]QDY78314.1 hypothetical protein FQU76_19480 [Streptomyces qinzhouensis]
MPRGRHRHSPPLHRLLPPSAVAGASVLSAAGAWLLTDPVLLRSLAAVAAAAAVSGAVLMRRWDRSAGRRVAEVTRGRANDAWQHEERVAELEAEADEARERRAKLETKLRAKRVELAKLRNEHAELLRRYAAAETGRASALEGRRKLAVEATAPQDAKEPATAGARPTAATYLRAAKALEGLTRNAEAQRRRVTGTAARTAGKAPLELTADPGTNPGTGTGTKPVTGAAPDAKALVDGDPGAKPLVDGESGAKAPAGAEPGAKALVDGESGGKPGTDPAAGGETQAVKGAVPAPRPDGTPDGDGGGSRGPAKPADTAAPQAAPRTATAAGSRTAPTSGPAPALPAGPAAPAPAAAPTGPGAIVPYGPRRVPGTPVRRPEGGFDFFGTSTGAPAPGQRPDGTAADEDAAIAAAQRADLADVVGDEALAEHQQHTGHPHPVPEPAPSADPAPAGEVIDLTAHDETEKLDMSGLRNALSS